MEKENLEATEKLEQIEASALDDMQEVTPLEESNETVEMNTEVQEPVSEMSTCPCTGGCGSSYSTGGCPCTGNCGNSYHKG